MDYSNNGFDSSGILNASSNSISIDLSPGNTVSRDNNSSDSYGYVSIQCILYTVKSYLDFVPFNRKQIASIELYSGKLYFRCENDVDAGHFMTVMQTMMMSSNLRKMK